MLKNRYYKILGFDSDCPSSYKSKLLSLGFIPGAKIMVKKIAPMGDPIAVELKGFCVSLRRAELALINLEESEA